VVLELGREGILVKTSSWEDNRTILAGERLQIENLDAHWELIKVPPASKVLESRS
jgi:sulfur relay (sulfurtransferase) DsrC/TusE family protein